MKIEKTIAKIPGGNIIVPLLAGTLLNTLWPTAHEYFGGVTGAYLTGPSAVLFCFFFCVGASVNLNASGGYIAKKGLLLSGGRLLIALALGLILGAILPAEGIQSGLLTGVSTLAVVTAFSQTNGGLYVSIIPEGREYDLAAFPMIAIQSGPFFTMLILGLTGGSFPFGSIVSTLLPFALGLIGGTLDSDVRDKYAPGVGILIPFFIFALGYTLNFKTIFQAGLSGVIVGVAVVLVTGGLLSFLDIKWLGSDGVAGWAQSSTAGAAVAVPAVIAGISEQFQPVAESATAIVATSVIVTAILTPLVTSWARKQAEKKNLPEAPSEVLKEVKK